MRKLAISLFLLWNVVGCTQYNSPLREGFAVDIYPVLKQIQVKVEKNKSQYAYDKVIAYVEKHRDLIFNERVTLSFSSKKGKMLLGKVEDYLLSEGITPEYLTINKDAIKNMKRFDFRMDILDYKVQTQLCKSTGVDYSYDTFGCANQSNMWHSKVHPENELSRTKP